MSVSGVPAARKLSQSSSDSEYGVDDLAGQLEEVDPHPSACGGFSDIYKYRFRNRPESEPMLVAVKSLRFYDGFEVLVEETVKKMKREIRAWIGLDHPNILKLLGIFNRPGLPLPCLVSPWMKNKTATHYLRRDPNAKLMPFILGIANGISHLHENNVAHGDIRGDNIFVTDGGQACIGDFGLSKMVDGIDITTGTSDWGGPSRWTAMEYLDYGDEESGSHIPRSPTKAGDIWSFGMSCLELWSGRPPYFDYRKEQVPVVISKGKLPIFPIPKRKEFQKDKERIKTLCILAWVKNPNTRPGIDILRSVIEAYNEADEALLLESPEQSPAPNSAYGPDEASSSLATPSSDEFGGFLTSPSSLKGSSKPLSSASPFQTNPRKGRVQITKTESLTSLSASDISEDMVNSMPELTVDSEGSSSGASQINITDEEGPVRGLIPLFAAPPPLPPTTDAMLNDKSISHKTSLLTYVSRQGKFNALKFVINRGNSQYAFASICLIEGVEYGRGLGGKVKDADENAARATLIRLHADDPDGVEDVLQYYPRFEIHLANHNLFHRVKWVNEENGSAHVPVWTCRFFVDGTLFAQGIGPDKRHAKEHASRNAALLWIDAMQ